MNWIQLAQEVQLVGSSVHSREASGSIKRVKSPLPAPQKKDSGPWSLNNNNNNNNDNNNNNNNNRHHKHPGLGHLAPSASRVKAALANVSLSPGCSLSSWTVVL